MGSKFSLEECRRYADHLHATGQGVCNPGGFAKSIYRNGEEDTAIEKFLRVDYSVPAPDGDGLAERDAAAVAEDVLSRAGLHISQCPDCQGTGIPYVPGKGAVVGRRCEHPALMAQHEPGSAGA